MNSKNTDKEKATACQKTPVENPNMKTDTQTADQWFSKAQDNENDYRNMTVEDYRRNKHSPETLKTYKLNPEQRDEVADLLQVIQDDPEPILFRLIYQRDEAKARADTLAEALRDLRARVVAEKVDCLNTTKADTALAEYEASKQ